MIRLVLLICTVYIVSGCSPGPVDPPLGSAGRGPDEKIVKPVASVESQISPRLDVSEPNGLLTLRDALSLTMMHSPELSVYSYATRAAQARQLQAGLRPNPELETEVENFGGTGGRSGFDGAQTTIQLSQLIDLSGTIGKRRKTFAYSSRLAQAQYDAKRLDISAGLTKTFIELLYIQEKQTLSQEFIDLSNAVVDSVDKRVQAGKDSPIDLSKARIGLAKAKLIRLEATQYNEAVRKQLVGFWGSRNPIFTSAAGRLDTLEAPPEWEHLQSFLTQNPEVVQRAIEVQQRQAELMLAKARSIPDLKIAGGVKYFSEDSDTAFVMGFSIPLPVFDHNQGGRDEAVQNLRMAQQQQQVTELSVHNTVHRLYADFKTAYQKARILNDEILTASEELFRTSKISYEQGKKDYLELLDSKRIYFTAKNDYINALAEYHVKKTELERLIGQNLQTINPTR
ncbi:MAG: TolC family protein [Planctomycetota bacterium]|jgi:cobalt-zinc-cadmium efflux system outer membrane protein